MISRSPPMEDTSMSKTPKTMIIYKIHHVVRTNFMEVHIFNDIELNITWFIKFKSNTTKNQVQILQMCHCQVIMVVINNIYACMFHVCYNNFKWHFWTQPRLVKKKHQGKLNVSLNHISAILVKAIYPVQYPCDAEWLGLVDTQPNYAW